VMNTDTASPEFGSKLGKGAAVKLIRRRKNRYLRWAHALMVGVLLTGEIHLFSAEILHHHTEVARVCQIEHLGGSYLHAAQDLTPLCPLCQIVRSSSVRPGLRSFLQKPQQESAYQPIAQRVQYSPILARSLLARAPPLS